MSRSGGTHVDDVCRVVLGVVTGMLVGFALPPTPGEVAVHTWLDSIEAHAAWVEAPSCEWDVEKAGTPWCCCATVPSVKVQPSVRAAVVAVLMSGGCRHLDVLARPEATTPACLLVTGSPAQRNLVEVAAQRWNEVLGRRVLGVADSRVPCEDDDFLVPLGFVRDADDCHDPRARGCVVTHRVLGGDVYWREVLIEYEAEPIVVDHELGHVVGCRDGEYWPPCTR